MARNPKADEPRNERPVVLLRSSSQTDGQPRYYYAVGGIVLAATDEVPDLAALAIPRPASLRAPVPAMRTIDRGSRFATLYDGPGVVAGREVPVTSHRVAGGIEVASGDCRYCIDIAGTLIEAVGETACADTGFLLGPVLVLALALNDRFCLHTSAIAMDGEAVCFLGDSGTGKSTIAATLAAMDRGIVRVIDDVGVFTIRSGLALNTGFPQPRAASLATPHAADVPVRTLVKIRAVDPQSAPAMRPLSSRQTWCEVINGTVAARLFDSDLLAAHLTFAATTSATVKGFELDYPKRADVFGDLRELLNEALTTR